MCLFSIHHMRAGSPRRRLLGREVSKWDWLGPSYALSLGHSDWFWARRWADGIGWAHPTLYHWVIVIGSRHGGGHMGLAGPILFPITRSQWLVLGRWCGNTGLKHDLSESSLDVVCGLRERFYIQQICWHGWVWASLVVPTFPVPWGECVYELRKGSHSSQGKRATTTGAVLNSSLMWLSEFLLHAKLVSVVLLPLVIKSLGQNS